MFQTGSRENRKSIDDSTQTLAQYQALKIRHNSFPLVIVGIREPLERQFGWKETIFWFNSIVAEDRDGWKHNFGVKVYGFVPDASCKISESASPKIEELRVQSSVLRAQNQSFKQLERFGYERSKLHRHASEKDKTRRNRALTSMDLIVRYSSAF